MKYYSFLFAAVLLSLNACSDKPLTEHFEDTDYNKENYQLSNINDYSPTTCLTRSNILKEYKSDSFRDNFITKDNLNSFLNGFLNEELINKTKDYSVRTIIKEERELLHIVNFNDGGWAIVSGLFLNESPILAYSSRDSFNSDNIDSPELAFWFDMILSSIEKRMITVDTERKIALRSVNYDDPYVWVRFPLGEEFSTTSNYSNLNHLTQTKWGQDEPWNYLCPAFGNELCVLGCTAVSIGQLLYYLNSYLGKPYGLYHTITPYYTYHYNSSECYATSTLIRSDYTSPSPLWQWMALTSPGYVSDPVKYVGNFLIDIANRASSKFYPRSEGTSGTTNTQLFSNYFGISCTKSNYYVESAVINSLNNSIPVLINGTDDSFGNHQWLIDGYNSSCTNVDHKFKWRMVPPDSLSFYSNQYDLVYTEEEMQQMNPDVIENEIIHEYTSYLTYMLRMNWGWNGSHYYDLYSMSPLGWNVDDYSFNNNIHMYYNFH